MKPLTTRESLLRILWLNPSATISTTVSSIDSSRTRMNESAGVAAAAAAAAVSLSIAIAAAEKRKKVPHTIKVDA